MKSILQENKECYISGRTDMLEKHHIFGAANRNKSEQYGLWVYLNHFYHNEPPCAENGFLGSAHFTKEIREFLRKTAQTEFEKTHTREDFRRIFGKSWI